LADPWGERMAVWLVAEWVVVKVEPWGVRKVVSMVDS
jgi:hypothetical protein